MKPETMWFITGTCGLYYGGASTRREAIDEHCRASGRDWNALRKQGDRAVKCLVIPQRAAQEQPR